MKEKQKVIAGYRSRYRKADRKGKRVYTDVIAALRLVRTFFWFKCGRKRSFRRSWPPLMRQQMPYIAGRPAFNITPGIAEKLKTISPGFRQIDTGGLQSATIADRPRSASMSIL